MYINTKMSNYLGVGDIADVCGNAGRSNQYTFAKAKLIKLRRESLKTSLGIKYKVQLWSMEIVEIINNNGFNNRVGQITEYYIWQKI